MRVQSPNNRKHYRILLAQTAHPSSLASTYRSFSIPRTSSRNRTYSRTTPKTRLSRKLILARIRYQIYRIEFQRTIRLWDQSQIPVQAAQAPARLKEKPSAKRRKQDPQIFKLVRPESTIGFQVQIPLAVISHKNLVQALIALNWGIRLRYRHKLHNKPQGTSSGKCARWMMNFY